MSFQYFNKSNILSTNALNTSYYRHVALTISGSTHTLYLDGSVVATNTNALNIFNYYPSTISNLLIGSTADLSYGYTGYIDDFKIWNRALPASDISSIYYTIPAPSEPSNLTLIGTTYYSVDISLTMTSVTNTTKYSVILSPTATATVTGNNSMLNISGLASNTIYTLNVVASNNTGSSKSSVFSFTTLQITSVQINTITSRYTTSIWLDTANSANFVLSSSNVTSWLDKTSNSYNVGNVGTITYNSVSPTSVLINAGSYLIQSTNSFNMLTSLQTWFFVFSLPSISNINAKLAGIRNNPGGFSYLLISNTFIIYDHMNNNLDGIYFNISCTANTKYLISVSLNTSTSYSTAVVNSIMRLNGTTQTIKIANTSSSAYRLTGTTQTLLIGALSDINNFFASGSSFNIYEMIGINNQALGINDIKTVEIYLNEKWNLGYNII